MADEKVKKDIEKREKEIRYRQYLELKKEFGGKKYIAKKMK